MLTSKAVHLELEGPFIGQFSRAEVITYPGPGDEIAGTVALYGKYQSCKPWLISLDRYRKSLVAGRILSMIEYEALLSNALGNRGRIYEHL